MSRLPGFCPSCGGIFASPLRAADPGEENAFDVPAPCPGCGGSGTVPGELLTRAAELAEWLEGPDADASELGAFLEMLRQGVGGEEGDHAILLEAARRTPSLVEMARRLPDGPPEVLRGYAALFRRVAEAATDAAEGPDAAARRAVERLLEEEALEPEQDEVPDGVARARGRLDRAGRNDPCPCGSGDKYKDCHWLEDLRITRS